MPGARRGSSKGKQQTVGGASSSDMELERAEQTEAIGFLKQQSWMHEDHIARLQADAGKESQMFSEELRLFNEERASAEAAAAHENRMLRLELDRLREETRATRHAKRQNTDLSHARWEAERKLHTHEETAAEESAKLQRRFMDLQGLLESQFRQSLKGLRNEYRAAALDEVGEEAADAIRECAALRQQTDEQRDVIHETLRRHDTVKAQRDEKRRDLELQRQQGQLLTSNAAQYRRQLKQLSSMAERAQHATAAAQLEGAATAAHLRTQRDEHRARAESLEEAYAAERKESAHWRRTALLYMDPDAAAEAAAAEAEAGALNAAAEQAPVPPTAMLAEAGPVAVAEIAAARYDNHGRLIGPDALHDTLPDQLDELSLDAERADAANVDLDAIWRAPADAAVGGFSPGGGGGGRQFQMARPPRKAGAAAARSRPASAASSPARPASAAPASRGGGSFGVGTGLVCCGAQAGDRPASAAPSVCAAGCAARGGAAQSLPRTASAPTTGLVGGGGGAFGGAASRSPDAANAARVPTRPGTAGGGGVRHAALLGTGGSRPSSAMRSAHTGSRPASPCLPSGGASMTTTTRLARPASAAALPGRRDIDAFSLLRPMPATGAGALPRSAAELAARRGGDGRPAQVRTCAGGFRAGGKQHSRISRERYFVPPSSRVTCQEGTTLFFVK